MLTKVRSHPSQSKKTRWTPWTASSRLNAKLSWAEFGSLFGSLFVVLTSTTTRPTRFVIMPIQSKFCHAWKAIFLAEKLVDVGLADFWFIGPLWLVQCSDRWCLLCEKLFQFQLTDIEYSGPCLVHAAYRSRAFILWLAHNPIIVFFRARREQIIDYEMDGAACRAWLD